MSNRLSIDVVENSVLQADGTLSNVGCNIEISDDYDTEQVAYVFPELRPFTFEDRKALVMAALNNCGGSGVDMIYAHREKGAYVVGDWIDAETFSGWIDEFIDVGPIKTDTGLFCGAVPDNSDQEATDAANAHELGF